MSKYAFFLLLNILWWQQDSGINLLIDKSGLPLISYCDLVREADLYKNKPVRVKASYFTSYHGAFFYDLACNELSKRARAVLTCENEESCKALRETLDRHLKGNIREKRVELIVVGIFRGPSIYGKPSANSEGFRFELEFNKIEKVIPIPIDTPWP